MVGPSPQDIQPQANQGHPNTFGTPPYPQQSYQPGAMGGAYAPQPYPPPQGMGPQGNSKNNKTIVSIGNFSLFAIAFSLVLFGTFTFLGGFLLGMWLESPTVPSPVVVQETPSFPPPSPPASSRPQTKDKNNTEGTSKQSGVAELLGDTAGDAVSSIQPPDTPDFLTPLITEAQDAAAKQAADKTQKAAEQTQKVVEPSSQPPSPAQPQTTPSPQSSLPPQRHGLLPTQTSQGAPTPSLTSAQPLSQQEGAYSIQLGVYAAKENAEALKNNLQALNYTTRVTAGKSSNGNTLYYVHSGSYKDYATASEMASQFTSRDIPGAVVIKISKNGNDAS